MTKRVDNPRGRPDVNAGKAWSEMDDFDLRNSLASNNDIGEAASFLCRSIAETQARADELGITGFHGARKKQKTRYKRRPQLAGTMRRAKGVLRPDKVGG